MTSLAQGKRSDTLGIIVLSLERPDLAGAGWKPNERIAQGKRSDTLGIIVLSLVRPALL